MQTYQWHALSWYPGHLPQRANVIFGNQSLQLPHQRLCIAASLAIRLEPQLGRSLSSSSIGRLSARERGRGHFAGARHLAE